HAGRRDADQHLVLGERAWPRHLDHLDVATDVSNSGYAHGAPPPLVRWDNCAAFPRRTRRCPLHHEPALYRTGHFVHSPSPDSCGSPRSAPMLGPPKPRRLAEPISVSLEDLVPQDNFHRHLEAKLDRQFVRDWV